MSKELIENFTKQHGWTQLSTQDDADRFIEADKEHVIFIPGDPVRNLESADVAVILPEIALYFQHRFDVAIALDSVEAELRERYALYKTPSLMFFRKGVFLGGIPKVRDWDDYITRTTFILNKTPEAVN